jgi:hypothetical protein
MGNGIYAKVFAEQKLLRRLGNGRNQKYLLCLRVKFLRMLSLDGIVSVLTILRMLSLQRDSIRFNNFTDAIPSKG